MTDCLLEIKSSHRASLVPARAQASVCGPGGQASKCRFFPAHPRSRSFPRNVRNWLYTLACHARLHVLQAYSTTCACIRTMRAGVLSVESVALWILQEVAVDLSPPSLEEIHCASGTI